MTAPSALTGGTFNEHQAKQLINSLGVPVPRSRVLSPEALNDVDVALTGLSAPFAVKFLSAAISHKTELGAVALKVEPHEVSTICRRMLTSSALAGVRCEGFLVEEMAEPGVEMVIGGLHDPTFGPTVMLGTGGVLTEVFDDVTFRICPVQASDAQAMVTELRGVRLLEGYRGSPPADVDALTAVVLAVGGPGGLLMSAHPTKVELDLNPVIVRPTGVVVVDAQVRIPSKPVPSRARHTASEGAA